ncbi:glycosyltransferase family 4 protein [uncultured Algibacter sp.]|uniref:glycosyltransferase family 4 protein n=1 Tax=uncultured Algibacter sp. TaxID=298659 RepID=UPI0032178DB6
MHIAFISPEYPHKSLKRSAGLGTSIKNLATGLVKEGNSITVFVVFQNEDKVFLEDGIKVISMSRKGFKFFGWYLERKHIQEKIEQEIENSKIDILEAPDWTGITAFMRFKIPLLIRLHGSDAYFCHLEGRNQKCKHYFFEKNALKNADKIISVSNFTANATKQLFNLKHRIDTIYNGIDTELFKPVNTNINKHQLLYFGTIIRKKGVLELANIFNTIVDNYEKTSLVLIGKDVKDTLENKSTLGLFYNLLTEKAKLKVEHITQVPYEEIKTYIAKAEVVVLPSFAEAFPMTWLETLAMEKALVTSNIGWASELMIDAKTGYMVNPLNHKEFAEKIIDLLKDKEKNKAFGENGRKHVSANFSTSVIIKINIEMFESLLSKNA